MERREPHRPAVRLVCAVRSLQPLLDRYTGRLAPWNSLGFTFWRGQALVVFRPVRYTTQMHIEPRIALTLVRPETSSTRPAPAATRAGRRVEVEKSWHRVTHTDARWGRRIDTHAWEQRFVEERRIIEERRVRRLTGRDERREGESPPRVPPVPRVVHRSVLVTEHRDVPAPGPSETPAARPLQRLDMPERARRAESRPFDVERLTDQVVRAIDRRIVAQRERRGRR